MTRKKTVLIILLLAVISGLSFLIFKYFFYIKLVWSFLNPDYSKLKSKNGIVSILVLGRGGEGHTAPDLTDTIIEVFVSPNNKKITTLSIPRDIWIPQIRAKINSAYYWGKQQQSNGLNMAKENVGLITGQVADYAVVVDFSLFKDLIDSIGGIEVEVSSSFVDNKYPIPGKENDLCLDQKSLVTKDNPYPCRYETISFEKGKQVMDGETALKFVRSRNAQGDEGTDIAREKRQLLVINAVKTKILSKQTYTSISKLMKIKDVLTKHLETDLKIEDLPILARMFFESRGNINSVSIPENYLKVEQNNPRYDYQYVFVPVNGSWEEFITNLPNQIY